MFIVENTRSTFDELLPAQVDDMDHEQVLDLLLDFYENERAEDADSLEEDGDMLLFQWGKNHDGGFYLSLTRQLSFVDDDGEPVIYHLTAEFHFEQSGDFEDLDDGIEWCMSPQEIVDFRERIFSAAAYDACAGKKHVSAELTWNEA